MGVVLGMSHVHRLWALAAGLWTPLHHMWLLQPLRQLLTGMPLTNAANPTDCFTCMPDGPGCFTCMPDGPGCFTCT